MKKIIGLILCLMLSVGILSGCSPNELAYAELINKMSNLDATDVSGKITLETPEEIEVSFKGESSPQNSYFNITVDLTAKTPKKKISVKDANFIINGQDVFIDKKLVRGLLERKETESFLRQFDAYFKDETYVFFNIKDFNKYVYLMNFYLNENEINLIKEFFESYKFKVVDDAENVLGYTFEIDYPDVQRISEELTEFLYKNKENLFNNENYEKLEQNLNILYNKQLKEILETEEKYKSVKDEVAKNLAKYNGSILEHTLGNYKDTYRNDLTIKILENKQELYKLKAELDFAKKELIKKTIPENYKEYDEESFFNNNGINKIKVQWLDGDQTAEVLIYNNEDKIVELETYNYILQDDRIYLPLRAICEKLGETVEWDAENDKAYIVRKNNKIDMTGMVVNDRTMIKIRDFEKLNYKIFYSYNEYGENIAIIEK